MYRDEFSGLYHTHFRDYDALHGRWLSEDPAGYADGLNLYNAYMGVNGVDPLGLAIYAFDGTGNNANDSSKVKTNIPLLAESYRVGNSGKAVCYYNGVGTYDDELSGGAFGAGARKILERAYADLVNNFQKSDTEIVIIGFSRGAAMAREFASMIARRGVSKELNDAYGQKRPNVGSAKSMANNNVPEIEFLGLFDTVGSFGVPGNSADIGKNMQIPDNVKICRHATAMHERRSDFPLTSIMPAKGFVDDSGRLKEKIFVGAHADVGGGYEDNYWSQYSLEWMHNEMLNAGVEMPKYSVPDNIQKSRIGIGVHNSNVSFWAIRNHPIFRSIKELTESISEDRTIYYINGNDSDGFLTR